MTKLLIIEDEPMAVSRLMRMLESHPEKFQISVAANGIEGKAALADSPDIVLLDVEMPGMNGVELLRTTAPGKFEVIFQSGYSQYAVTAFERNACDFLLKPFTEKRLHEAVDRALSRLKSRPARYTETFFVKTGASYRSVPASEVDMISSRNHHTYLHVGGNEMISDESLALLEQKLDPEQFFRISRQCILNRGSIRLASSIGGKMRVVLNDDQSVTVSRSRKRALKKFLSQE